MSLVPRASARDTAGVVADVVLPLVARGVIVRRPRVVDVLDRVDADRRAVRRLQSLRATYGDGPVLLRLPRREAAIVLSPSDVHRVLEDSPDPFSPANLEKRAALSSFEPHGVLISKGAERAERRRFNEEVLDSHRPVHRLGDEIAAKIREEAEELMRGGGALAWPRFAGTWWRIVRRVVLGDSARDDTTVTDLLRKLRRDANWAYLKPTRKSLRDEFLSRVRSYIARGEPGSLASLVSSTPAARPGTFPVEQVPQWLFAFDAAGMASFRALALLDAYPEAAGDLRACVLESIRLWPTTPVILRDTTAPTSWATGELPAGTALVITAPFFHRDDQRLSYADSFAPDLWSDSNGARGEWPLVPFSGGPGECPGRNLVLFTSSRLLADLLETGRFRQAYPGALERDAPLPLTFSPFRLRFERTTGMGSRA